MPNNIIIGYTPNDFFYSTAGDMPKEDECKNVYGDTGSALNGKKNADGTQSGWDDVCNDERFMDNSGNCIKRQLCINKQNVDFLVEKENSHLDAEKRNNDINVVYDRTIMDSVNLGIGILFILFLIYRNRNVR
jgi:hypothetical protein